MQYHEARNGGGFAVKHFQFNSIYIRPSMYVKLPNLRQVERYYHQTFLSNPGNYDAYETSDGNCWRVCHDMNSSSLTFRMPVGNLDHRGCVEIVMITINFTIFLIFYMFHNRYQRRTRIKYL